MLREEMQSPLKTCEETELVKAFIIKLKEEPLTPSAVSAVIVLMDFLMNCEATTFMETKHQLKEKASELQNYATNSLHLSTVSGCQLFLTFVSDFDKDHMSTEIEDWKNGIVERGKVFIEKANNSRQKAASVGTKFIRSGATILTHSYSRTVMLLLLSAAVKKRFSVIVTEGRPDGDGYRIAEELSKAGIPVTVVLDSAVGRIMERVDMVIVGAEGVTENGGIINKVGTFPIAITAANAHKPVYAIAESFKFARLYPLRQDDLPVSKEQAEVFPNQAEGAVTPTGKNITYFNPLFDFTPPKFVQLLFTDLGVLTPSGVSDELIKLYQI